MTDAGTPVTPSGDPESVHQGGFDLGGPPQAGKHYRVLARKYRPSSFDDLIGQDAVVRTVSFIRQQYPYGADDPERIRLFIRDAYARWGTKWVLLGGDTDVITVRLAFNVSFYQVEHIAADIYY